MQGPARLDAVVRCGLFCVIIYHMSVTLEKIVNLCKRRGIIFPGSEIYGGLANTWDYGPLGVELLNNLKALWWKKFVQEREDVVGLSSPVLMNAKVWEASGHLKSFTDPLVECKVCHLRFRSDQDEFKKHEHQDFTRPREFNLMFKTFVGPAETPTSSPPIRPPQADGTGGEREGVVYLRPETAQGMFVDFNQIVDTARVKLPFGIAQIGKSFRNEITAGNFIFRTIEFEIAEVEYFVKPGEDEKAFDEWLEFMQKFLTQELGINKKSLKLYEHPKKTLAHYSKRTVDIQYKFPWGWDELWGLANRTDFDLKRHAQVSGKSLKYRDPDSGEEFLPFVIEPTGGIERALLAVLLDGYSEVKGGRTTTTESTKELEVVLKVDKKLAPVKVAVLPLSRKEGLTKVAREAFDKLRRYWVCQYDETASIGRRYRRQDEIGTPYCVTVDFESLEDKKVTVRDRDTMKQERVGIEELISYFQSKLA